MNISFDGQASISTRMGPIHPPGTNGGILEAEKEASDTRSDNGLLASRLSQQIREKDWNFVSGTQNTGQSSL